MNLRADGGAPGGVEGGLVLQSDALSLVLAPRHGASWQALRYRDPSGPAVDLLRPSPAGDPDPYRSGGFALVPWSNRLFDGHMQRPDQTLNLPANRAGVAHPVHGVAWMQAHEVLEAGPTHAVLRLVHAANDFWPQDFECRQTVVLEGLSVRFQLTLGNTSRHDMPAGLGFHPWLATDPGDTLRFEAERVWLQDDSGRPERESPIGQAPTLDGRTAREIDAWVLNHGYSAWTRSAWLARRSRGLQIHLHASERLSHLMVYRPAGAHWICVEPVSHATGAYSLAALHRPEWGVHWLAPGAQCSAQMTLDIEPWPQPNQGAP